MPSAPCASVATRTVTSSSPHANIYHRRRRGRLRYIENQATVSTTVSKQQKRFERAGERANRDLHCAFPIALASFGGPSSEPAVSLLHGGT